MRRLLQLALLALVGVLAAGCGGGSGGSGGYGAPPATTTDTEGGSATALSGSVGPGFDISMNEATVAAGTYTLSVDDQATSHNFHLTGPGGVDVMTDIGGTGAKTFTVKLERGTYSFVCDAHPTSMKGTLTVS
jgi:plastocyanin